MSIFKPYISYDSIKLVEKTLQSGYINEGENVIKFEKLFSNKFKIKNALTVNSCTSALHLALVLCGIKQNDEVILPAQTFIATASAVLMCGAKPVFADINLHDGNISLESIKRKITRKTKAIIVVHWAGYPCDLKEINLIAKKNNIKVIEDAAHALGAKYDKKFIGNFSDFTCFSFQAIKHLTTGDGGMLCAKRKKDHDKCSRIRWFGIDRSNAKFNYLNVREPYIKELGYKYHMNNISAAIGIGNLKYIKNNFSKRNAIARMFNKGLKKVDGLTQLKYKSSKSSSWWMYNFLIDRRKDFAKMLIKNHISFSAVNTRIDKNPIFQKYSSHLEMQNLFEKKQISLSTDPSQNLDKVDKIINIIRKGW